MSRALRLASGSARVAVDLDHGARLSSLSVTGLELLVGPDGRGPTDWGCFPMAPWAGRLRHGCFTYAGHTHRLPLNLPPHAIHGTVHDVAWEDEGGGVASVGLGPPWPLGGRVVQRFTLTPSALHLTLEVHAGDDPMPASCGWHPWFRRRLARGRDAELAFEAALQYEVDRELIPAGATGAPGPGPWDDTFTGVVHPPQVRWPGALALTLDSACSHLVVFDRPDDALCVEPQTAPPDALNRPDVHVVEPGRPLVARLTLYWEPA